MPLTLKFRFQNKKKGVVTLSVTIRTLSVVVTLSVTIRTLSVQVKKIG